MFKECVLFARHELSCISRLWTVLMNVLHLLGQKTNRLDLHQTLVVQIKCKTNIVR